MFLVRILLALFFRFYIFSSDLQCIIQTYELRGSLKKCPLCRAPMSLVFFDFNPQNHTCSVIDLNDVQNHQHILMSSSTEFEDVSLDTFNRNVLNHPSTRKDVPLGVARSLMKDKTGFFTPIQRYRRKIYLYKLYILDPYPDKYLKIIGLITFLVSLLFLLYFFFT